MCRAGEIAGKGLAKSPGCDGLQHVQSIPRFVMINNDR